MGSGGGFLPETCPSSDARAAALEFADIVGSEGRELIAELVDGYWLVWPWFVTEAISLQRPHLYEALDAAFTAGRFAQASSVAYNAIMYSAITAQSLFWGGWLGPRMLSCRICTRQFDPIDTHPSLAKTGLAYLYCGYCSARAIEFRRTGVPQPLESSSLTADEMAHRLQRLASVLGFAPLEHFRSTLRLQGLDENTRDRLVSALITMPPTEDYLARFGRPWTRVLISTGLLNNARQTTRGTMSLARDGHLCRSLGERIIDDFFDAHGIVHECEPPWPHHKVLNPSQRLRADWRLFDGVLVEYAGLAGDPKYDARTTAKRNLAAALEVPLIVVLPHELTNLGRCFRRYIVGNVGRA